MFGPRSARRAWLELTGTAAGPPPQFFDAAWVRPPVVLGGVVTAVGTPEAACWPPAAS